MTYMGLWQGGVAKTARVGIVAFAPAFHPIFSCLALLVACTHLLSATHSLGLMGTWPVARALSALELAFLLSILFIQLGNRKGVDPQSRQE